MKKDELRKKYLKQRSILHSSLSTSAHQKLLSHVLQLCQRLNPSKVFLYSAFRDEVELKNEDFTDQGFLTAFPRMIEDHQMVFINSQNANWQKNKYGILEPEFDSEQIEDADAQTVVLAPCLAVTESGYRLGYGGGYYDRYMQKHPKSLYVAVIFDDLVVEDLPQESTDQPVQYIVTEKRVLEVR